MSGSIEDIAKRWMMEPDFIKMFKHTADVIWDYISFILTAIGGLAISVRFITTLGAGDLTCILEGKYLSTTVNCKTFIMDLF